MKKVHRLISSGAACMMVFNLITPVQLAAQEDQIIEIQAETQTELVNVALNKPVVAAAGNGSRAVDGDLSTYWDGGVAPSELFVDLEGYFDVSSIQVIPYYAGSRYYHYEVYVSSNGSSWKLVGEKADDTTQTSSGETFEMEEEGIRYVRVKMTYNSANPSVHINELRVFGVENPDYEPPYTPAEDPNDPDNIAYAKPTRADTNNGFAYMVNDGDRNTSWSGEDYPKYVDLDLMENYDLNALRIYMPEDAEYAYTVYTSTDGAHFSKVYESGKKVSDPEGDLIELDEAVTARIIRVACMANSKGEGANSRISEIKAYGTLSAVPKTETRTDLNLQSYDEWLLENYQVDVNAIKDENGNYAIENTFTDEDVYEEVNGIITRLLGEAYVSWFEFELAENTQSDQDYYEISIQNGKVHIKGNEGLSLTSGLNHYLKYYCNVHVSQQTSQVNMPEDIVTFEGTIRKDSPYEVRYAYNYCTLSYTMPFWGYDEWQREMDWFALNGVNLILDTTATEALWVEYLQNYGYSIDEAKAFVCGYSYKAWWLMGNLEAYGGPVSDEWIQDTVQMARVNQRKMHVLGMQPCLQGFMGAMPENFGTQAKQVLLDQGYADITDYLVEQGTWSGFTRPPILKTTYDGWNELAETFYETQEMIYGQATKYYAGDLAHEGGIIPPDLSKPEMSAHILNRMMEYDSDAVWIIQSWLSNPNKEILQGFGDYREDHVLILDLDATENPHWSNTTNWNGKEFGGTSWVFCMLDNYGGRTGMHGELEYLATQITKANANSEHMKGIGITPEGTLLNPVNYDLFWEMAWETEAMDTEWWLEKYIERRYGTVTENAKAAWDILLDTAYSYNKEDGSYTYHTGNNNCITNMRPSFSPEIVIGSYEIAYDATAFEKVMDLMMADYDLLKDNECWVYDMVDILRQTTANAQVEFFNRICEAYEAKDMELFSKYKEKLLNSILILDEVSAFEKDSLYGTWISKATNFYNDPRTSEYDDFSKDLMVINAKAICSIWSSKTLQTYGHRQYAGMEADYNYPMWSLWLDRVETAIETGIYTAPSSNVDYFNIGWDMVTNGNLYSTEVTPVDGTETKRSMQEIWQDIKANYTTVEARKDQLIDENIAPEGTAYAQSSLGSYTPEKLNDGNSGTLWINQNNQVPTYCGLTFATSKQIYAITLVFETRATLGANVMDVVLSAKQADGTYQDIWSGKTYDPEKQSYTIEIPLDETITTNDLRLTFNSNGGIYPAIAEMKVYASTGILLMDGSEMFISDGSLCGVPDGWTVGQVREWLKVGGGELVFEKEGVALSDDDPVDAQTEIKLISGNNILDHLTVTMASQLTEQLSHLIAQAQALNPEAYSSSSYALVTRRVSEAQALLEKEPSSSELKTAITNLQNALNGLVNVENLINGLSALQQEVLDYISSANKAIVEDYISAVQAVVDGIETADSTEIYTAYGQLETAFNALLPEDNSNIAPLATPYSDNNLSSYYAETKLNNGNYEDCWVANSRTNFPVKAGLKLDQARELSGMKIVFEQNGYRNTRIGYEASVQLEDGTWVVVGNGECSAQNGYTFYHDLSDVDGAIVDARITLTTYATDAGTPYPGVAELELYEKTDTSALEQILQTIRENGLGIETGELVSKANYALSHEVSQSFIDTAVEELNTNALIQWKEAIVQELDAVNPDLYSPASYALFEEKAREVRELAENAQTLEEMAAAAEALKEAFALLQLNTNTQLLEMAVAYAQAIVDNDGLAGVNTLVANQLLADLQSAKDVLANEQATQSEIDEVWVNLTRSIHMLGFLTDKTQLAALVAECEAINLDEYLLQGQDVFKEALEFAKAVLEDDAVLTDQSIQKAIDDLTAARDALILRGEIDTRLLQLLVETCQDVDLSRYISQGQEEFLAALEAGQQVLAAPETQEQVTNATNTLHRAWLSLRLKADESLLEELAQLNSQLGALVADDFTAEQFAQITQIRDRIESLLADAGELSQAQAQEAITAARQVLAALDLNGTDQAVNVADPTNSAVDSADRSASVSTGANTLGVWGAVFGIAGALTGVFGKKRKNKKQ